MPPTLSLTLVEELADDWQVAINCGANILTDHSIIVHRTRQNLSNETFAEFYRSTDDGLTWNLSSSFADRAIHQGHRAANLPDNVYLFPTNDVDNNYASIKRSVDGCETWDTVAEFNPGNPVGALICADCVLGYDRNSAFVTGLLARDDNVGYYAEHARSTDVGVTFADIVGSSVGVPGNRSQTIAKTGNGKWILGHDANGFWLSSDYGASWSAAGTMAPPPLTPQTRARSSCWLTDDIVFAGGSLSSTGDKYFPWLWRSTNGGAAWTHVAAGSIANWPNTGSDTQVVELKRLTRDSLIMGLGRNTVGGLIPWRYSIDAGVTWLEPSATSIDWSQYNPTANGAIVTTPAGAIICPISNRHADGNTTQIWRGTITC